MAISSKKDQQKQGSSSEPSCIVLEFDYDKKYVLPIEQGTAIVKALASARCIKTTYGKSPQLLEAAGDMRIEYISEQQLAELVIEEMIDPGKDDA